MSKKNQLRSLFLTIAIIIIANVGAAYSQVASPSINNPNCAVNKKSALCRASSIDYCTKLPKGHFCKMCRKNKNLPVCASTTYPPVEDDSSTASGTGGTNNSGGGYNSAVVTDNTTPSNIPDIPDIGSSSSGATPPPILPSECQVSQDCPDYPHVCCVNETTAAGTRKACKPECSNTCTGITGSELMQCDSYTQAYVSAMNSHNALMLPVTTHNKSVTGNYSIVGHVPMDKAVIIYEKGSLVSYSTAPAICVCSKSDCEGDNTPAVRWNGADTDLTESQENHLPLSSAPFGCAAPKATHLYYACGMGPKTDVQSTDYWTENPELAKEVTRKFGGTYAVVAPGETPCQSQNDTCRFQVSCANGARPIVETPCRPWTPCVANCGTNQFGGYDEWGY